MSAPANLRNASGDAVTAAASTLLHTRNTLPMPSFPSNPAFPAATSVQTTHYMMPPSSSVGFPPPAFASSPQNLQSQSTPTASSTTSKRVRKQCSFPSCQKVDAGGGFCVGHGGGKKCSFAGCTKGYQTGGFCRKHGGGARCQVAGCGKVDAGKGLCRAHGGGKRCQVDGCPKADVGGGFCTAHGGGKRCTTPGCTKIDQGGGKCRAHGGSRRCRRPNCSQTARGATGFCTEHGGARLCARPNCRRIARMLDETLCAQCAKEEVHQQLENEMKPLLALSPSLVATVVPVPEVKAPKEEGGRCNGSQIGSCLENGCARSFGGKCNCDDNCSCCGPPKPKVEPALSLVATSACDEPMVPLTLARLVLRLRDKSKRVVAKSMLQTIDGVRSVHTNDQEQDLMVMICDEQEEAVPVISKLELLSSFGISFQVVEEATISWLQKEMVVRVPEMMCPGNCGRTVLQAMRSVRHVDVANLIFGPRRVVARGAMDPNALLDAIEAVGFDAQIEAIVPVATRFRFRVQDLVETLFVGKQLIHVLQQVEGVESIVLMADRAEVLVLALQSDASELLQVAARAGIVMVQVPESPQAEEEGERSDLSSPSTATTATTAPPQTQNDDDNTDDHVCDIKVCPQNGCQQYMATVAHTAALAVGWVVPGCAMSWGGECTCGENCRCKGCPKHNPIV